MILIKFELKKQTKNRFLFGNILISIFAVSVYFWVKKQQLEENISRKLL